jgi:uncharacterized protein (TIGR02466 family)
VGDLLDQDRAGREWSKLHYVNGFTSYASANELHQQSSTFQALEAEITKHVKRFARDLEFELGGRPLRMTKCWANVMPPNTHHGLHLHPLSVISGTYYVDMPKGASAIKFEDPRLPFFMHSPPRRNPCRTRNKQFVEIEAEAGSLILFESWLRHEVPLNRTKRPRISISFNYAWE